MTTTPTEVLRQARDAPAYLLPLAEMQPADIEPGHHLMQGDCPDETRPGSRDEDCPACQRMISAAGSIAAIDAMPSAPAEKADPTMDWPIARLTISGDKVTATMCAPGLPDGDHDVWCIPVTAPSVSQVAHLKRYNASLKRLVDHYRSKASAPADFLYIAFSTDGKAIRFWTHDARVAEDWSADNEAAIIAYTPPAAAAPEPANAGAWLRKQFGATRAHPEWRALTEAFNAGHAAASHPAPAVADPAATVSISNDIEGLVQWAGKRVPVGTSLYAAAPAVAATVPPMTEAEVTELLSSYDWRGDGRRRLVEVTAQVCATAWGVKLAAADEEQK